MTDSDQQQKNHGNNRGCSHKNPPSSGIGAIPEYGFLKAFEDLLRI
jgi:hypothetical protein